MGWTQRDVGFDRSFRLFAILVFALLAGLNYSPALIGKIPFPRDLVLQFPAWKEFARSEPLQHYADIGDLVTLVYPFRAFAATSVRSGTLPLWNPYFQSGAPFQADPQSALFYPLNFFYYVLPTPVAWAVALAVRMMLAGLFTTLFVREVGGTKTGSVFSGIVFASCGFITAWQGQCVGDASIWLPLVGYAIHRLHRDRTNFSVALTGIAFAMPVLAGHPETALHVTLAGMLMAAFWWAASIQPRTRYFNTGFLLSFALAGLLALGLASIQIIPTLEWLRGIEWALKFQWPVSALHDVLAWASRDILRYPSGAGIWVPNAQVYAGMITLLAASQAPFHKAKKNVILLAAMIVLGLCIAHGIEPVNWLVSHTPMLGGVKNDRIILLADFGIAALAGLGISVLQQESFSGRRRFMALCLLGASFVLVFILVYNLQAATQFKVEFTRRPSFSRALLFLGLVPISWRLLGGLRGYSFPVLACALVTFDLVTFSYGYMGFARPAEIFPPAPAFDFLAKQNDPMRFRIAEIGSPYSANANIVYRIDSADGYDIAQALPRMFALDFTQNRWDAIYFFPNLVLKSSDRRMDMLNLKYFVLYASAPEFKQFAGDQRFRQAFNNGQVAIFENKSVLPRAFAVPASGIEVLQDTNAQLERMRSPSFDPQRSVILSEPPLSPATREESQAPAFNGRVDMLDSRINEFSLRASASGAGVLVWSQTYYPGWKATVDGKGVPVLRVNMALTGIEFPPGSHEIRFVFQPLSFRIGMAITILTAMIVIGLLVLRLFRQVR
ncbi:MAG TPA: YfhO family protein [Terriglobia bacterium]|nr:YfhO family protein [Terriglobia bacterium]